ncbi:TPA: hypothetical protein DDX30_02545 [Candidatus Wolfebacteria bacterium]|nr:hypothetical protein [Candidatus Wolfebacteria bacterium]
MYKYCTYFYSIVNPWFNTIIYINDRFPNQYTMNQFKKWALWIATVVIIAIGGYQVWSNSAGVVSKDLITIGFIGPLTGENAAIGEGIKNAIALSAKDVDVRVIYEDDQFDSKKGIAAYQKLRTMDKVDAIINTTPTVIDTITPLLQADPIVVIQIAEPELSGDDTIFQIMPSGASLYARLGEMAREDYASFAFVHQEGAAFEKAKNYFKKTYENPSVKFNEYRIDDSKDYRTVIAKMKRDGVIAYTVIATPSVGVQFIKQVKEQGVGSVLVCNADMEVTISEYLKVLPQGVFEGCKSAMFADRMADSFKVAYKNAYGVDAGFATDYGFDAVRIIKNTYDTDNETWVNVLKHLLFDGASGRIQFDDLGVRVPEIEEHVFKDGVFVKR